MKRKNPSHDPLLIRAQQCVEEGRVLLAEARNKCESMATRKSEMTREHLDQPADFLQLIHDGEKQEQRLNTAARSHAISKILIGADCYA